MNTEIYTERTLVIIKPAATREGYVRPIQVRAYRAGFKVARTQVSKITRQQAERFYAPLKGQPRFETLVASITGGQMTVMILEKENAIAVWAAMMGNTNGTRPPAGTIRHDFTRQGITPESIVHGSESFDDAQREITFFFGAHEANKRRLAASETA